MTFEIKTKKNLKLQKQASDFEMMFVIVEWGGSLA